MHQLPEFLVYSLYRHARLYFNVQRYFNVQTAAIESETRKCDFSSFFLLQTVVLVTFPVAMTHYLTKDLQKKRVPSSRVQSLMVGTSRGQELETAGHTAWVARK